jgi:hypothetical protein
MAIALCDNVQIENNTVDTTLYSNLFIGTEYANTNLTVQGNRTPGGDVLQGLEDGSY